MEWNDFGAGAAVGGVLVAVMAIGIQWRSGDAAGASEEGDRLAPTRGAAATSQQMDVIGLREALAQERARVAELESALAREEVTAPKEATAMASAEPAEVMTFPFHYTGLDGVLAKIDWAVMGSVTADLLPLLTELGEILDRGDEVPLALAGQIQSLNGKLLEQAQTIVEGIPGAGVNGSFSHPLVVANQLHAVFQSAGVPLDADQTAQMQALAAQYAGEDDQRRATYSEETPKLQALIDEMAMKERFYAEARGVLDTEQLGVISNPAIDGHTGIELMGTGMGWSTFTKPASVTSLEEFGTKLSKNLSSSLNIPAEQEAQVSAIVQKWARRFPQNLWQAETSNRAKYRMIEVERVRQSAQTQLGMVTEILNSLPLSPQQRQKLLSGQTVFVPMRRN